MKTTRGRTKMMETDIRMVSVYTDQEKIGTDDCSPKAISDIHRTYANYAAYAIFHRIKVEQAPNYSQFMETDSSEKLAHESIIALGQNHLMGDRSATLNPMCQRFLVYTDIAKNKDGYSCYTQEEADRFWSGKEPFLFIMTVTVADLDHYRKALRELKKIKTDCPMMVYQNFTICDLVIFVKCNQLLKGANQVFSVIYQQGEKYGITGCMPIFGTRENAGQDLLTERFSALLRFHCSNLGSMHAVKKRLLKKEPDLTFFSSMGRRGQAAFTNHASIELIRYVEEVLNEKRIENQYQHKKYPGVDHFSVIALFELPTHTGKLYSRGESEFDEREKRISLCERMLCQFEKDYTLICKTMGVSEQSTGFLTWMKESYNQAISLTNDPTTISASVCLLNAYHDYFYLFREAKKLLQQIDYPMPDSGKIWEANKAFFHIITVLTDSMDHSDRQYVHTTPFHITSFDMPPKLLSFYTGYLHCLIHALQDDQDSWYGAVMYPCFVPEIQVTGTYLFDQRKLEGLKTANGKAHIHQEFLTMEIGEDSLYDIPHILQVLCHEISHYVGERTRQREERKHCMLRFVIFFVLQYLFTEWFEDYTIFVTDKELWKLSGELYESFIQSRKTVSKSFYASDTYNSMLILQSELLASVAEEVLQMRSIRMYIADKVFDIILRYHGTIIKRTQWQWISILYDDKKETRMQSDMYKEFLRNRIESKLDSFAAKLQERNPIQFEMNKSRMSNWTYADSICSYFRETFADLQTIILLKMDQKSYEYMLKYHDGDTIPDIQLRISAVASVMENEPGWKRKQDIEQENSGLFNALKEYLTVCKQEMDNFFSSPEQYYINIIRNIYKEMQSPKSINEIGEALMNFQSISVKQLLQDMVKYLE